MPAFAAFEIVISRFFYGRLALGALDSCMIYPLNR